MLALKQEFIIIMKSTENNGICVEVERIKNYELHVTRLQQIRSKARLSTPSTPRQLFVYARRRAILRSSTPSFVLNCSRVEERLERIDHENQILLNNLIKIDRGARQGTLVSSWRRRDSTPQPRTIPVDRRKEFTRINTENQLMLQRLSNITSAYSRSQWARDYEANQQLVRNMSHAENVERKRKLQFSLWGIAPTRPATTVNSFRRGFARNLSFADSVPYSAVGSPGEAGRKQRGVMSRTWIEDGKLRPRSPPHA